MAVEGESPYLDKANVAKTPQALLDAIAQFNKGLYAPATSTNPDPGAMGMFGNPLTPYGSRGDQIADAFIQNRMVADPTGKVSNPILGNKLAKYNFATHPANVGGDIAGVNAYSPGVMNPFSGRGGSNSGAGVPQFTGRGNGPQGGNPGNGGGPIGATGATGTGPPPVVTKPPPIVTPPPTVTDPGIFNPPPPRTEPPPVVTKPPPIVTNPTLPDPPPPGPFGNTPPGTGAGTTPGLFYNGSYPLQYPLPPGAGSQPLTVDSKGPIPNPTNDPTKPNYDPYLPGANGAAPEKYGNPDIMDVHTWMSLPANAYRTAMETADYRVTYGYNQGLTRAQIMQQVYDQLTGPAAGRFG